MVSPAQVKATTKYIREKTRRYVVQCNRQYDADVIDWLESKPNVAGYIKELIREDMRENL